MVILLVTIGLVGIGGYFINDHWFGHYWWLFYQ
jgi:hypothetical protein